MEHFFDRFVRYTFSIYSVPIVLMFFMAYIGRYHLGYSANEVAEFIIAFAAYSGIPTFAGAIYMTITR